jgi:hypothetical protein
MFYLQGERILAEKNAEMEVRKRVARKVWIKKKKKPFFCLKERKLSLYVFWTENSTDSTLDLFLGLQLAQVSESSLV